MRKAPATVPATASARVAGSVASSATSAASAPVQATSRKGCRSRSSKTSHAAATLGCATEWTLAATPIPARPLSILVRVEPHREGSGGLVQEGLGSARDLPEQAVDDKDSPTDRAAPRCATVAALGAEREQRQSRNAATGATRPVGDVGGCRGGVGAGPGERAGEPAQILVHLGQAHQRTAAPRGLALIRHGGPSCVNPLDSLRIGA
jgi:hypothetical protein